MEFFMSLLVSCVDRVSCGCNLRLLFVVDLDFLDVDNFQLQKPGTFNGLQAYKNSKLCNVLMAYHMAGILKGQQVMVNAVDPGVQMIIF